VTEHDENDYHHCGDTVGLPVTITGGSHNPNSSLQGVSGIRRSDSVVTVPVFNCPLIGACDGSAQPIVGFLQLGIQDVTPSPSDPAPGDIEAVILKHVVINLGTAP